MNVLERERERVTTGFWLNLFYYIHLRLIFMKEKKSTNAKTIKAQIIHKIKYDLKSH